MPKRQPSNLPIDQQVYDAYPALINNLVEWAMRAAYYPLEAMAAANDRITHTRALIGPTMTIPTDPVAMAGQRQLIEAAVAFRQACMGIRLGGEA